MRYKAYSDNKLKFDGEYLNIQKNGKGKEYDYYGLLIYDGEYLNEEKMEKEKNMIIIMMKN